MMRNMEQLIELISSFLTDVPQTARSVAEAIIADGWTKDPCRVGDPIFWVYDADEEQPAGIYEGTVEGTSHDRENKFWINAKYTCGLRYYHEEHEIGKHLFFDRDHAERELKIREENRL